MVRSLATLVLGCMTVAQLSFAQASPQNSTPPQTASPSRPQAGAGSALPPPPPGKSTVIGGAIRAVDPVRDQFTLQVFGGRPMKILYDERTQFYRNGEKTPIRDLRPEAHASVQTVLDGTKVYALSIHVLAQTPDGEVQGQVLSFNPATGQLAISTAMSRQPIKLRVPTGTPVVRVGQGAGPSDVASLVQGTLVSVNFQPGTRGQGIATHIAVLATPGSTSVFSGSIGFLDLPAKTLVVVDPRDGKSYKITFDPSQFPISRQLHQGMQVRVTATFDGTRYNADTITAKP